MSICMVPIHVALDLLMFLKHLALRQLCYHTMQLDSDPFAKIKMKQKQIKFEQKTHTT